MCSLCQEKAQHMYLSFKLTCLCVFILKCTDRKMMYTGERKIEERVKCKHFRMRLGANNVLHFDLF